MIFDKSSPADGGGNGKLTLNVNFDCHAAAIAA